MSSLLSPFHIEAVGLANLRFFAPPSGAREFPWLSIDDLQFTMPSDVATVRVSLFHSLDRSRCLNSRRSAIVPHFMAQGLIDAMSDLGVIAPDLHSRYVAASAKAMGKLTEGMSPQDLVAYLQDAWRAAGGFPADSGRA